MSDILCSGGAEGPWVFEVPAEMVHRLAKLNAKQLQAAGKKWAATEEFSPQYDNWTAEAVQQVLRELAALCKRADGEGKAVLMWMCL
jgi:hypothetical protein